jgi:FtsP/CotA-like multicopper oxidase with cupredoxin domain
MVSLGQQVCVAMYNINADAHVMHLHGHSFQVTNMNGVEIDGAVRDTLLTPRGSCTYAEFCFEAQNPGEWPFHCHMTYHLYAGMLTTVKYA